MKDMHHRRTLHALALTAALLTVAGCASLPSQGTPQQASASVSATVSQTQGSRDTTGPITATGHGWTQAGLQGTMPAPGTCHYRAAADGAQLPDPHCNPGSVDAAVNQGNIGSTIGRSGGYTSSVRPPAAMTEAAKKKLMAAYGIPWSQASQYELDHEIPLCMGGSSNLANLWPQRDVFLPGLGTQTSMVHNSKDLVEDYLCQAVREHRTQLAPAQKAIAADWTTAVKTLGLPPIPAGYRG